MTKHRGLLHHQIIVVSDIKQSARFYGPIFRYFGYELNGFQYDTHYGYEDWKRWDLDTPHEISICQVDRQQSMLPYIQGAVGHHHHIAFCAASREDVDCFYKEVLVPLEEAGLCIIEDPPCECPEYGDDYYATFFLDPDGLKYEFVINLDHLRKKKERKKSVGVNDVQSA